VSRDVDSTVALADWDRQYLEAMLNVLGEIRDELRLLREQRAAPAEPPECEHEWGPTRFDGVQCTKCSEFAEGWYCPTSPTHQCVYDSAEDPRHDSCVYCGDPEERK
jgi:hypothetical protein